MYLPLPSMRRSRHPLARVLSLVLGLVLLGMLLIFGLLAAGILLVGGSALLAWRYWTRKRQGAPTDPTVGVPRDAQPKVLEGEFVVLRREGRATR
jgi:4-hydroxybenzoate polyprenyltransferase